MDSKFAKVSDFLKGLFAGVWIGITEPPWKSKSLIEGRMQKRREAVAEDRRTRSEIGHIPPEE
jgi:hypothetical protein